MGNDNRSIENSGWPLAFAVESGALRLPGLPRQDGVIRIRTMARALSGMQKEALIQNGPDGRVWRVVCDEGPWLNGTDLAPFPLAFFAAGLAASLMAEILAEAKDRDIAVNTLRLLQDNFFTMEGSALAGTMKAGVDPLQVKISIDGAASVAALEECAASALHQRCPAARCLHEILGSGFAVRVHGEPLSWPGTAAPAVMELADPAGLFERIHPVPSDSPEIIRKTAGVPSAGAEAVGLKAQQKRVVHVSSECTMQQDGLIVVSVQCMQPAGSRFVLLSDVARAKGGQERAPDGLTYLAAGAAFCFMTQIGRYAQITKQKLDAYRIVQDTAFGLKRDVGPGMPVIETLVLLETAEPAGKSLELVQMSEQTCYVHAAFRGASATEIRFAACSRQE